MTCAALFAAPSIQGLVRGTYGVPGRKRQRLKCVEGRTRLHRAAAAATHPHRDCAESERAMSKYEGRRHPAGYSQQIRPELADADGKPGARRIITGSEGAPLPLGREPVDSEHRP